MQKERKNDFSEISYLISASLWEFFQFRIIVVHEMLRSTVDK